MGQVYDCCSNRDRNFSSQKTAPTPQFSIEEEKQNGDLLHLLTKSKENDFNSTKNNNDAIINEHSSSEYKFDKNLKHFFSDKIILESQNNHKENIILSSNIELFSENADNNNFLIPDKRQEKETKSFSKEKILNRKAEFEKRIKETINSQSNVSSQLTQFKQKNNIKNIENEPKTSSPEKNIRPKEIKNFKTPLESIEEEEGERKKTMEIFHPTISQYVKTSTGKKIKETLAERVRILEKHFGGSDDNQENESEITKENEKKEILINNVEYHESKNIINFDTNSIIQPLLSEYISTVTGKKISKNLMDRINMLENLFGSQESSTSEKVTIGKHDRSHSDDTNMGIFRPELKKKSLNKEHGAGIALSHITMERTQTRHKFKKKSSLLFKSLDLDN